VNFVFIGGKAMKYIIIWVQCFITVNSELQNQFILRSSIFILSLLSLKKQTIIDQGH